MAARLLVTGAGTGASNNLIRSLKAGDLASVVVGCHDDRFVLKKSSADLNYLIVASGHRDFGGVLRRLIETEKIDLLIPTSDSEVRVISRLRHRIPCRVFLPRHATIELSQDKCALTAFLRRRGLPAPRTYPVTDLDGIEALFRQLGPAPRLWCRIRRGSGSTGAIPVNHPEQARSWIEYWEEMRGVPPGSFTLSEYLPGRDFACQSVWKDGHLVLIKVCERLSYFAAGGQPSGVSSTPALAKTVDEPRVAKVCADAVRAVDGTASGVFSIDLKEDSSGVPCITEINAGRFFMITPIFDLAGKHNMADTFARLALGEAVEIREEYEAVEDHYLVRDLDTLPGIYHASDLFQGVNEARWPASATRR